MKWISVISPAFHSRFCSRTLEVPSRSWNACAMNWLFAVTNQRPKQLALGGATLTCASLQSWPSPSVLSGLWRPVPASPRGPFGRGGATVLGTQARRPDCWDARGSRTRATTARLALNCQSGLEEVFWMLRLGRQGLVTDANSLFFSFPWYKSIRAFRGCYY